MTRPLASVSLDLDNLWSYQRTHGDPIWQERRSYLPALMPGLLDLLDEARCRITFFVVGADAAAPASAPWIRMITERGHEVGNHTFHHECWLQRYTRGQLVGELEAAEDAIERATGQRPTGFRGPGFSWSPTVLEVLADRAYVYDASTLPTFLGPLARAYFLATARLTPEQRREREGLFGSFADGFRPVAAYRWQLASGRSILEIPVTTTPGIRTPFHMSYLIYLHRFSPALMHAYLRAALALCRWSRVNPSFLLHPLDLLGPEHAPELAFFPGMDVPSATKRRLVRDVLSELAQHYTLMPMSAHAAAVLTAEASAMTLRRVASPRTRVTDPGAREDATAQS